MSQLNLFVEIRKTEDLSTLIRCIDKPDKNWASLFVEELGKVKENSELSDCWERVHFDLVRESGVIFSTDQSLGVPLVSDVMIDYIIAFNKDNHKLPVFGVYLQEFFQTLQKKWFCTSLITQLANLSAEFFYNFYIFKMYWHFLS